MRSVPVAGTAVALPGGMGGRYLPLRDYAFSRFEFLSGVERRTSQRGHAILWRVDDIEALCQRLEAREDVRLAYLFGSEAKAQARASSDIDVAVVFAAIPLPRDVDRLVADLQTVAKRRVDLVILNTAPPLLGHEVLKGGRLIVCRDEDERVRFETRIIARYLDTVHLRRVQQSYLHERAEALRARPG
jgi:predicted nucleotidyltransferase